MKREKRRGFRKRRCSEPGEKEQTEERERKQWRQGEPERDGYKGRQKSGRTQREPEGTVRPGNRGDVWWGVRVTELNPGSQGDQVPAGGLF